LKDTVYKIFRYFNQGQKFVDGENLDIKGKVYYYLLSLIFSDARIPFEKVDCKKFVKGPAFHSFENWLKKEYFQEAVENINEDNLYYYFSYLYTSFHLQSPQIRIFRTDLDNVRFPYIDSNLFRFLYKMPQSYGRGLEFNSTKLPLKKLAKKILSNNVFKILESGPHSYLSEVEDLNFWDEIFLKGPLYKHIRGKLDFGKCRNIFDDNAFYVIEIDNFIKKFKQGKIENISPADARFLLILTLLSVYNKPKIYSGNLKNHCDVK
jgi:hypothetical protein